MVFVGNEELRVFEDRERDMIGGEKVVQDGGFVLDLNFLEDIIYYYVG